MIPVYRLDNEGAPSSDPIIAHNCIKVRFTYEPVVKLPDGKFNITGLRNVIALLDTGANLNVLDSHLFAGAGAPQQQITSFGTSGSHLTETFKITMMLENTSIAHSTIVLKGAPMLMARPYSMILGRKFLQCTRFNYDGVFGITNLEYFEGPGVI